MRMLGNKLGHSEILLRSCLDLIQNVTYTSLQDYIKNKLQ